MQVGELLVAGMGTAGDANWQASVDACCTARGPHGPSRDDLANTAGLLMAAGRADRAVHLLTHVVEADPDDLATRRTLAWALCVVGKPADAVACLAIAQDRHPDERSALRRYFRRLTADDP